jgi:hypothetical protein
LYLNDFLMRNNRAMERKPRPKPKNPATTVRLPAPLHQEVKDAADRADHSMNDEIILRLRLHPVESRLERIEQEAAELRRMVQQLIDRSS